MDFGKRADPCGDCWDGHCTMNCGPAIKAGPKAPRYTVASSGGEIFSLHRDGNNIGSIGLKFWPNEERRRLNQRIADLLNTHGEG